MAKNKLIVPFLKWVGGKRQLIEQMKPFLPKNVNKLKYYEPFMGGGAVFFYLHNKQAVINDANTDLINAYKVVKNNHAELIENLRVYKNTSEYFYKIRELDRNESFKSMSDIERASRYCRHKISAHKAMHRI